jgi:predicted porin
MLKKIYFLFAIILIMPFRAFSQETDFDTWITLELKGKLFKLVNFDVVPELRLWDNSTRVESMLGEVEVSVPLNKYFQFGVAYRAQLDVSTPDYNKRNHRFSIFAEANYKIKRLRIGYRAAYHQEYTNIHTSELGDVPETQHRHKISLKYNIKKSGFSPYVSAEMFFTLKPEWKDRERKLRTSLGIQYKINKKISASMEYKFQRQFYTIDPKTDHILGLGMEYNL